MDSIEAQSQKPAAVIVVDDGSTDGTADMARKHPLNPTVIESRHGGAAAARNLGLELVDTEWTLFFDSDDTMAPDHIATASEAIDDGVDIIGWNILFVNESGKTRVGRFYDRDVAWHNLMHGGMGTQRYMARTELFRKCGGWDPNLRIWDDVELGMRLLALRPRIRMIKGTRVFVQTHDDSISGLTWSGKNDKFNTTLEAIGRNSAVVKSDWVDMRRALLAADIAKENKAEGKAMYDMVGRKTLAVRLAYRYRLMGGRGAAFILRKFFSR